LRIEAFLPAFLGGLNRPDRLNVSSSHFVHSVTCGVSVVVPIIVIGALAVRAPEAILVVAKLRIGSLIASTRAVAQPSPVNDGRGFVLASVIVHVLPLSVSDFAHWFVSLWDSSEIT
jgi:hypothetical protein